MYSTLCRKLNQGEAAKLHNLLEIRGLHPLTLRLPLSSASGPIYTIKLDDDEIEKGRQILVAHKCNKYLAKG